MKLFNTVDDFLPEFRTPKPWNLKQPKNTPDAALGKAVCAWIIATTPKPTFRGVRVLLRSAVE